MAHDAVLIPGGGLTPAGELPPWSADRLETALAQPRTGPLIVLSAGSPHRPGTPQTEARAACRYLLARGVPPESILEENLSWDTIGNALFARLLHTAPRGWRRLLVVTSDFHLARTRAAFEWVFSAEGADRGYTLDFLGAGDRGLPPEALLARQRKEAAALARLKQTAAALPTLAAIHTWLFTEHAAYAAGRRAEPVTDPALLASY